MTERRHLFYEGRVQGVGFRYTVRGIAARYVVSGFVRNLHDARVELVAEGSAAEVARFLAEVQERMDVYIAGVQSSSGPATGEYARFEIR